MKPTDPTRKFLRQYHRRARSTLLLWSVAATLATVALAGLTALGWSWGHDAWTLTAGAVAAVLLGAWLIQARGLTVQRLAHGLDVRWTLHARLESAAELAGDEASWAVAQRNDAHFALANRKVPGRLAWRGAHVAVVGLTCFLIIEAAALIKRSPPAPVTATATVAAEMATPEPEESTYDVVIQASLGWKSPDSEIQATAIEEVPLTAVAESKTGFRSFSLEMLINGEREVSRTIDPAQVTTELEPGRLQLEPSLFLDELAVEPFDVVTYRLVGELETPEAARFVTSPPQFVQIRPPVRDAGLNGNASELPALLFDLKSRQLQLIKENAALARLAPTAAADPTWATENARVAQAQDELAVQTAEVRNRASEGVPHPLVLEHLSHAREEMTRASKEIAATHNEEAATPQNRALALIIDLEQFICKALTGATPASNPIPDEQTYALPPRSETPAGELEALAERQKENNTLLNSEPNDGTIAGTSPATEQAAIAQGADLLSSSPTYGAPVREALMDAGDSAAEAARQLSFNDREAALVPAAAAQRAFERAVDTQERMGRAVAVAELERIRRSLNAASRASADERAAVLESTHATLRSVATQQQRTGSATAARELMQLAERMDSTSASHSSGYLREVAAAAAYTQIQLEAHAVALRRAVRLLNRTSDNLTTSGGPTDVAESLATLEVAGQEARWITSDAQTIRLAQQLVADTHEALRVHASDEVKRRELGDLARELARTIELGRTDAADRLTRFDPASIDPLYRDAVEDYFERLSRGRKRNSVGD